MRPLLALALVIAAPEARADGFFYQQSYGVSSARGDASPYLGESLQLRIALGWRIGHVQVGPWLSNHLAWYRDNAYYDLIGGDPEMGDSDVQTTGIDGKYSASITSYLSTYVRGGPRYARGFGALDGRQGMGIGAGGGIALTGKVRALGFLAVPLFFKKWGPKITASLFVDYNVEWYRMSADGMPDLSMPIVGASIGFGAGSYF